jgi:hypothetical protein
MVDEVSDSSEAAALSLIEKLRTFVTEQLNEEEGTLFAALVAPGVSLAYVEDEVTGFGAHWETGTLPQALCRALQEGGVRVEGLRD